MKYVIALLLLAGCGTPEPYTGYAPMCGTVTALTLQTGHNALIQSTAAFTKVCSGTAPSTSYEVWRANANPTCGFTATGATVQQLEVVLSSDWVACP